MRSDACVTWSRGHAPLAALRGEIATLRQRAQSQGHSTLLHLALAMGCHGLRRLTDPDQRATMLHDLAQTQQALGALTGRPGLQPRRAGVLPRRPELRALRAQAVPAG